MSRKQYDEIAKNISQAKTPEQVNGFLESVPTQWMSTTHTTRLAIMAVIKNMEFISDRLEKLEQQ